MTDPPFHADGPPPSLEHRDARLAAALAVAVFTIYALGACRTIYVGDSGELVAAAATLGIPHPSGYPLYVLLGKAWISLLPLGSVALRMSLFSAAAAAACVALLHLLGRQLGLSRVAALFGALVVAFSPSYWSQANIQRVYSLNALFVVGVTFLAVRWWQTRNLRFLTLAAFVAGLGAANHTFIAILGLTVGVFALAHEPALLRRPLRLLAPIGAGIAGLGPYLYLPLRSRQEPRLDWGNPETWENFRAVIMREDFWPRRWMESAADWLPIAADYVHGLGEETLWIGLVLAAIGAWLGRRRFPVALPVLVMLANLLVLGCHGSRSDIFVWHRYYIPSYLMLALLAAMGAHLLSERSQILRRAAPAVLLIPAALLVLGWPRFDRSDFQIAEDFSRQLLATLPPGAHLAASDDNVLFVLIYLHLVEGVRPDVDLILQGVGDAALPALRFDPDDDPLFFTHHPNWNHPQIEVEPLGLVFRTSRRDAPATPLPRLPEKLEGEDDPRVPKDYLTRNLIGHFHATLGMTWEERDWPRAQLEFERAAEIAAENDVLFYNLGLIYRRRGMLRRALDAFERSHAINPRHLASGKPARASDKIAELRPEVERLEALEERFAAHPALAGLEPGTAPFLRGQAELLRQAGAPLLARGRELLADEIEESKRETISPP